MMINYEKQTKRHYNQKFSPQWGNASDPVPSLPSARVRGFRFPQEFFLATPLYLVFNLIVGKANNL